MPDKVFRRIAKILVSKRGRPMKDAKSTLEGIMDRYQGGYQWRKLPQEYGHWNSVFRAHRRWCERQAYRMLLLTLRKSIDHGVLLIDGTFAKAHRSAAGARRNGLTPEQSRREQGIGKTRGGLNSKIITLVDRRGRLAAYAVVPGNAFEPWWLPVLLDRVPLDQVRRVLADGLYRTVAVRRFLADHGITFVSKPETNKRNAEGPVGPRDPNVVIYKGRGIVENVYADDQNFRGFATRYDKTLSSFCGGFELTTWYYESRPHKVRKSKYLEGL